MSPDLSILYPYLFFTLIPIAQEFFITSSTISTSANKIVATIPKLKGTANYEVWALRIESFLIKEGLATTSGGMLVIDKKSDKALTNLRLLIDDGPLLQISHLTTAKEVWESFKALYSP